MIEGVISVVIWASRSITVGSVPATVQLRVIMIRSIDETIYRFPSVGVTVFVDDTSVECTGPPRLLVTEVVGATKYLTDDWIRMGMELSPSKNVCVASRKQIADAIMSKLPGTIFKAKAQAKVLGAALTANKRRNVSVCNKRLKDFRQCIPFYRKVKRTIGASCTFAPIRTGGLPAMTHGQLTCGVSCSQLHKQRVAVAAAGNSIAGELGITLCIMDGSRYGTLDPAYVAHTDPIWAWAEAVWGQWLPRLKLEAVSSHATTRTRNAKSMWASAYGPATGCIASLHRLQWTVYSPFEFEDDRGKAVNLLQDSPAFVRSLIVESVRRWRWRRIETGHPGLAQGQGGYGLHFQPLFQLCFLKNGTSTEWTYEHAGALRSALTNRQWTQVRLSRASLVMQKWCDLCVRHSLCTTDCTDPAFLGTLTHRLWTCPVLMPFREKHCPQWLLKKVWDLLDGGYTLPADQVMLFTRAMHKSVEPLVARQPARATFDWIVKPPVGGVPVGRAYADGSRLYVEHEYCNLLARVGWAFAIIDMQGNTVAAASGVTP